MKKRPQSSKKKKPRRIMPIRLGEPEDQSIAAIRRRYGLPSAAAAVRFALARVAAEIREAGCTCGQRHTE